MSTPRRAAIYCRVSSHTQDTGDPWASLPRQEEALRLLAEREHAQVVIAYREVYSGVGFDRPGFLDLMARARRGEMQAIYVVSFDRLTRAGSMAEVEVLRRELIAIGVDLISPAQRWEFSNPEHDTPDTEFLFNVQASAAAFDRRKIVYRLKRGLDAKARAGGDYGGYAPYGYKARYDEAGNKSFVVVDEQAAVVRRVFDDFLAGLGTLAIAKALNSEGIASPSGKRWGRKSVRNLVRCATYAGLTEYLKPWLAARRQRRDPTTIVPSRVYPAIVPVDTWKAARAIQGARIVNSRAFVRDQHPLAGIARCLACGSTMEAHRPAAAYGYYRCRSKNAPQIACPKPQYVAYQEAHAALIAHLVAWLPSFRNPKSRKKPAPTRTARPADGARARIAALEQEIINLARSHGQGVLSDTAYTLAVQAAEAEHARHRLTLAAIAHEESDARQHDASRERLVAMVDVLRSVTLDRAELRDLFARVLSEVRFTTTRDHSDRRRTRIAVAYVRLQTGDVWPQDSPIVGDKV